MKLLKVLLLVSIPFVLNLAVPVYSESLRATFVRATVFGYDDRIVVDRDFVVIPISARNPSLVYRNVNVTIYGNISTDGNNIYINVNNRRINLTIDKFIDLLDKAVSQNFSLEREFANKIGNKTIEFYEDRLVLRNRIRVQANIIRIFVVNTTLEEEITIYFDGRVQRRVRRPIWWFLVTNVS